MRRVDDAGDADGLLAVEQAVEHVEEDGKLEETLTPNEGCKPHSWLEDYLSNVAMHCRRLDLLRDEQVVIEGVSPPISKPTVR